MRSSWLFIGLLLGQLVTATAFGQAAEQPADVAREHFRRGEAAYQKGSYALAISEWQAAYTADPRPRIQFNIYQAYERLGQLQEGAAALERYLSTADPDDPYYSDATARMAALQQRLQATGIRLMGGVEGASINVSGHDWGRIPRPDRIPVQPGNHRIVISLAGYHDFVANVVVPPGQVVDVAVQLEPNAAQPAPLTPPSAPGAATAGTPRDQGGSSKLPLYITAGVLGAGAIGSAIWMADRFSELSDCSDEEFYCAAEDTVSTQRTISIVTTAALGAGAIGVLLVALLTGNDDAAEKAAAAPCLPTAGGASCRVSF
jgi:PEGA domain